VSKSSPAIASMTFVDRSNTNWSPWPRLAGIPQRLQVVGGVAAILATAGVLFTVRKSVSPPLPKTMEKEWKDATAQMSEAKEREAAGPVMVNPITRSRGQ
jgi:Cytochrome c oxidase subunit IV